LKERNEAFSSRVDGYVDEGVKKRHGSLKKGEEFVEKQDSEFPYFIPRPSIK